MPCVGSTYTSLLSDDVDRFSNIRLARCRSDFSGLHRWRLWLLVLDEIRRLMHVVLFSGPEPIVMPITGALNDEEASARATIALATYLLKFRKPYRADEFKVEKVLS